MVIIDFFTIGFMVLRIIIIGIRSNITYKKRNLKEKEGDHNSSIVTAAELYRAVSKGIPREDKPQMEGEKARQLEEDNSFN